jgi:Ankyrin repeats (3 copies)/Ankyrin repeat
MSRSFFEGPDPSKLLYEAIQNNSLYTEGSISDETRGKVLAAVAKGANVTQYIPESIDTFGNTPLIWAAGFGDEELVNHFLKKGALTTIDFLNTMNTFGQNTALTLAIKRGHFTTAQQLLDAGANPDMPCTDGVTPLQLAILSLGTQESNEVIINLINKLIEKGADIDKTNNLGYSARYYLTEFRYGIEDLYKVEVTNLTELNKAYPPEQRKNLEEEFIENYIKLLTDSEKEKVWAEANLDEMENISEAFKNALLRDSAIDAFHAKYDSEFNRLKQQEGNIIFKEFLNREEFDSFRDFMTKRHNVPTYETTDYYYVISKKLTDHLDLIVFMFQDHPITIFDRDNRRNNYLESAQGKSVINDIISLYNNLSKKPKA